MIACSQCTQFPLIQCRRYQRDSKRSSILSKAGWERDCAKIQKVDKIRVVTQARFELERILLDGIERINRRRGRQQQQVHLAPCDLSSPLQFLKPIDSFENIRASEVKCLFQYRTRDRKDVIGMFPEE